MANPVVHWEIGGQNLDSLRRFYGELFSWDIDTVDPDYGLVAPSEGGIGGGLMRVSGDVPAHVTIYVAVPSLEDALARVQELGGQQLTGPTPIPGVGAFALLGDPEGNVIGLITQAS